MPPTGGYRVPRLSLQDIANNMYAAIRSAWWDSMPDTSAIYSAIKWGVFAAFSNPEDVSNPIDREDIQYAIREGTRLAFSEWLQTSELWIDSQGIIRISGRENSNGGDGTTLLIDD